MVLRGVEAALDSLGDRSEKFGSGGRVGRSGPLQAVVCDFDPESPSSLGNLFGLGATQELGSRPKSERLALGSGPSSP